MANLVKDIRAAIAADIAALESEIANLGGVSRLADGSWQLSSSAGIARQRAAIEVEIEDLRSFDEILALKDPDWDLDWDD